MTLVSEPKSFTILVADDDEDDRTMIQDAIRESGIVNLLHFVKDGEELLDFLNRKQSYQDPLSSPRPDLILLDLNMPKMDGKQALREIKGNPLLRGIPVIALTTSTMDRDIDETYDLGINSFITKPVSFEALVQIIRDLAHYWLVVVKLPGRTPS